MSYIGKHQLYAEADETAGTDLTAPTAPVLEYIMEEDAWVYVDLFLGTSPGKPLAGNGMVYVTVWVDGALVTVDEHPNAEILARFQCIPYKSIAVGALVQIYLWTDDSNAADVAALARVLRDNERVDVPARGMHHVPDSDTPELCHYAAYHGVDALPDFTAAAYDTWDDGGAFADRALPAIALPGPGATATHYFAIRRTSRYGIQTLNETDQVGPAWSVTIDETGAVVATPPSAPEFQAEPAGAGGTIRVTAQYYYLDDLEADRADAFLVWTKAGSAPDPDVDVADAEVACYLVDGVGTLDWTSAAYAGGTTVYVVVRTRRSGTPDVDSTNTDTAVATTTAPTAPEHGALLLGTSVGERQ